MSDEQQGFIFMLEGPLDTFISSRRRRIYACFLGRSEESSGVCERCTGGVCVLAPLHATGLLSS